MMLTAGNKKSAWSLGSLPGPGSQPSIFLTRPTAPLSRRTLMPWGWVGDFVRISFTIPSVSLPDRWSCF